jgi:protein-tyrosine phosphatase
MEVATHPLPRAAPAPWTAPGELLRRLRHAPDRLMHRHRHAAALARVRAERLPTSILFVCEGNIFRSPFAAAALESLLPDEVRVAVRIASAGFLGPGRMAPPPALRAATRRGVDLTAHRSALVTHASVYGARLIVVMEPRQKWRLRMRFGVRGERVLVMGDLDPLAIATRAVVDPWEADELVLESAYARVGRCARAMADALAETALFA